MKAQTVTSTKPSDARKRATAFALQSYFDALAAEFTGTPPLRRLPPEKLRNDILHRVLTETYDVVRTTLPDKRIYNSVFRQTFKPLIRKAWQSYPKR